MSKKAAPLRNKLDEHGIEKVCLDIVDGKQITQIAHDLEVSKGTLIAWIAADADRSARVKDARAAAAIIWDEKAETGISGASDQFELARATQLAHHYRWRASKIGQKDYGDKQQIDHTGSLTLEQLVTASMEKKPE